MKPNHLIHLHHILGVLLLLQGTSHAAVSIFAEYHLGEAGSLGTNNLPLDTSGNPVPRNFTTQLSGSTSSTGSTNFHPNAAGSTAYLDTSGAGNEGWYGADFSLLQNDNFAFGVFASASSLSDGGDVFTLGGNGGFKLSLTGSGWSVSAHNVAVFAGTATFTPNQWVHLALVRNNGFTSFYVDGQQIGSSSTIVPVNGTGHMVVSPGGATFFDGRLDEARVVTFNAGESTANILNSLQGVPEPSVALLGGLSAVMLLRRRRME